MARALLALLLLGGCVDGAPIAEDPVGERAAGIVNGTRDPQVNTFTEGQIRAVGWLHSAGYPGSNFCSGTLVTPTMVATARHCVRGSEAGEIGFGIGRFPGDPEATFAVTAIYEHPEVDAAALVLAEDATTAGATPIAANTEPLDGAWVGTWLDAAGYGETYDYFDGRFFAKVELVDVDWDQLTVDGNGEQGICFGDSGGPVIAQLASGELAVLAVESWGSQTCVDQDHMTRLDPIASWLEGVATGDPDSGCGGVDYFGTCEGTVAVWCANGVLRQEECEERHLGCGWVDDEIGFYCVEVPCGADLSSDVANCGVCANACVPGEECAGGRCRCPAETSACEGGCVDVATSLENCGGCGALCAPANASGACAGGRCGIAACTGGFADTNADPRDGCEVAPADPDAITGVPSEEDDGGCASASTGSPFAWLMLACLPWFRRRSPPP